MEKEGSSRELSQEPWRTVARVTPMEQKEDLTKEPLLPEKTALVTFI